MHWGQEWSTGDSAICSKAWKQANKGMWTRYILFEQLLTTWKSWTHAFKRIFFLAGMVMNGPSIVFFQAENHNGRVSPKVWASHSWILYNAAQLLRMGPRFLTWSSPSCVRQSCMDHNNYRYRAMHIIQWISREEQIVHALWNLVRADS